MKFNALVTKNKKEKSPGFLAVYGALVVITIRWIYANEQLTTNN